MRIIILLCALVCLACDDAQTRIDNSRNADACFTAGGVEYQAGTSGGSYHQVCVWRK